VLPRSSRSCTGPRVDNPFVCSVTAGVPAIDGAECFVGDEDALLAEIATLIRRGEPQLVMTPNVDMINRASMDAQFRVQLRAASLRLIDGAPLEFLFRRMGARSARRHTGADLLPQIAIAARVREWRVLIAGGAPGVAKLAAQRLNALAGRDVVSYIDFPMLDGVDDAASLDVINEMVRSRPNIVFLCLGSPKQEAWYFQWKHRLPAAVYVGAGAAVDFASGTTLRAPRAIGRMGLEWVWRLALEPRRLAKRYLVHGPRFLSVAAKSFVVSRKKKSEEYQE
jgi:N-acetylglucosaminyldiphosphoundecaprenol N-acetyl-beta-D-mannosaminyltransferase